MADQKAIRAGMENTIYSPYLRRRPKAWAAAAGRGGSEIPAGGGPRQRARHTAAGDTYLPNLGSQKVYNSARWAHKSWYSSGPSCRRQERSEFPHRALFPRATRRRRAFRSQAKCGSGSPVTGQETSRRPQAARRGPSEATLPPRLRLCARASYGAYAASWEGHKVRLLIDPPRPCVSRQRESPITLYMVPNRQEN